MELRKERVRGSGFGVQEGMTQNHDTRPGRLQPALVNRDQDRFGPPRRARLDLQELPLRLLLPLAEALEPTIQLPLTIGGAHDRLGSDQA